MKNVISFLDATPYSSKDVEKDIWFELFKIQHELQYILSEEINMPDLQCPALSFSICKDAQGYICLILMADNKHYELDQIRKQVNIFKDHLATKHESYIEYSNQIENEMKNIPAFNHKAKSKYIGIILELVKELKKITTKE